MRATRCIPALISLALAASALAASCELLGADSLSVSAWSPSEKNVADPAAVSIWVEFSKEVDRHSAEAAFTLKGDGAKLEGRFSWSGPRMGFEPFDPLRIGVAYLISVSTDVETADGISLGEPFETMFETRTESVRPFVASVAPADGGTLDNGAPEIVISFSEIIELERFLSAVSLSPSVRGYWTHALAGPASEFTFHPAEPYTEYEYRLGVDASLTDLSGNEMPEDFEARFYLFSDRDPPVAVSVSRVGGAGSVALAEDLLDDATLTLNHGMNAGDELEFSFDEPVTLDSFKTSFSFDPDAPIEYVTTASPSDTMRVRFGQRLDWGSSYAITLRKGLSDEHGNKSVAQRTWRVAVNGVETRPPEPLAVAFKRGAVTAGYLAGTILAPEGSWGTLHVSGYPILSDTYSTYLDLYLRTAPGGAVDLFSLMKSLSFSAYGGGLSTTSVKATSMSAMAFGDIAAADLDLVRAATGDPILADVCIVRVMVSFKPGFIGNVLSVELSAGLSDGLGNPSADDSVFIAFIDN